MFCVPVQDLHLFQSTQLNMSISDARIFPEIYVFYRPLTCPGT